MFCCLNFFEVRAQQLNLGYKIGFSASFGNTVQRIGACTGFYTQYNFIQFHVLMNGYYVRKSFGLARNHLELQSGEGIAFQFGNKHADYSSIALMNHASNYSQRDFNVGYTLKQYINGSNTSQSTALIHLSYRGLSLSTENDAFLFSYFDRFRTAAFNIRYEWLNNNQKYFNTSSAISAKLLLFTGDVLAKQSNRILTSRYPARNGYMDLSKSACGQCSHGIIAIQVESAMLGKQAVSFQAGIDDEHIRHRIQNKWIHDINWLPADKDHYKNPHVPMLQENGEAYLFESGTKVRKARSYIQVGMNEPDFY
ncbi:MAG: hypothetical protein KA198_00640 [Chitinophagaceae bacterium]|nr:hypothetical protein [Chitinophagaceae bacterium]